MGFDAETKDGHRIYWPERRTVSVERSVKFNVEQESVVVGELPLEGERMPDEHDKRLTPIEPVIHDVDNGTVVPDPDPVPEATEGRGKHIRMETEYVRRLREGEA